MEAALALIVGAWTWADDFLRSIVDAHPFWCLFLGIIYCLHKLEQSINGKLNRLSDQIATLEDRH